MAIQMEPVDSVEQVIEKLRQQQPVCAYVYNLALLRRHVTAVVESLPAGCQMFYALKANSDPQILRTLAPIVHGFEVASLGEIQTVRQIAPTIPVIFGGPGKDDQELVGALHHNVELIHVESLHELRRLEFLAASKGVQARILLRINLRQPLPSATLQMAGRPTQFGIDEEELSQALELCQHLPHIQLEGFHLHCLSNNVDAERHVQLMRSYGQLVTRWSEEYNLKIRIVNVGGGIGINFAHLEQAFDWNYFVQNLQQIRQDGEMATDWRVIFECGRYLTAACGTYAVEVLDIKRNHGQYFVIVAGGTHHFRLPASWQHSHPFRIMPIEEWSYPFARPEIVEQSVTVAGQLCSPKDILARDIVVPRLRVGDILLFQYTGAYGWSISHHDFLSHPHPKFLYIE